MLSKESFIRAIEGIQKHDRFVSEINDTCRKYSMEFYSANSGDIVVAALLDILAAEMDDTPFPITPIDLLLCCRLVTTQSRIFYMRLWGLC